MIRLLLGFLRKDAKVFGADRQAVVMALIVPLLVASILGWLDTSAASADPNQKITFLVVDLDQSETSKAVIARLAKNDSVKPQETTLEAAQQKAKEGSIVAILPKDFGNEAVGAMAGGEKPKVVLLTDPSKPSDDQVVEGAVIADAASVVARQAFGSLAGDGSAPLTIDKKISAAQNAKWAQAAHDFAGFGLMGLLFFAIEAAVSLVRDRRLGIWRRLRASPVDPRIFVLSRGVSSTVLALAIILFMFFFGGLLFGIRILGSVPGFLMVAVATALMAACFGLLIAVLGRSESQARGVSILVIFVMLASGGAWFPLSRMPGWVQNAALYMPVRWSVEGFDAMTWRGLPIADGARYAGVLCIFGMVFLALATFGARFARED